MKLVRRGRNRSELEVVLLEGRNREIRRVLAAKGVKVRRLIRTGIGALSVESLKSGQYRRLEKEDIDMLRGKP